MTCQYPVHRGSSGVAQLNQVYREQPPDGLDSDSAGFEWVDCNDMPAPLPFAQKPNAAMKSDRLQFHSGAATPTVGVPSGGFWRGVAQQ